MDEAYVVEKKIVASISEHKINAQIVSTPTKVAEIAHQGLTGPIGPVGPMGPEGQAGGQTTVIVQDVPSSVWTIIHNLNKYPTVTIVDSGQTVVEGDIVYLDTSAIRITFSAAFSGTAYLN